MTREQLDDVKRRPHGPVIDQMIEEIERLWQERIERLWNEVKERDRQCKSARSYLNDINNDDTVDTFGGH